MSLPPVGFTHPTGIGSYEVGPGSCTMEPFRRVETKSGPTQAINGEWRAMNYPFPGMDPYLEHPVLWESVHAHLIVAIANQLQPRLDPRYIASIEERVFIEGPQRRIPDVWIQRVHQESERTPLVEGESDTAVIVEVENLELHERRVEILDSYNGLRLVCLIEAVSPTNKAAGPGRESYRAKQKETLGRECHLVEIDLLRQGRHVVAVPEWRVKPLEAV